ncbi:MAG: hypothetical protein GWN29_00895 [Gammaproteobacteria bacterium]|nr:hypothetical protein [Gammaproteobacteria bacterium]
MKLKWTELGRSGRKCLRDDHVAVARLWLLAAAPALSALPAAAQQPTTGSVCPDSTPTAFHACAVEAASAYDPPRTPDGQPDFGGVWDVPGSTWEDLETNPGTLDDNGYPTVVVDPPDGRVPMQAWSDERRRELVGQFVHPVAACFLSGVPYLMLRPAPFQFLQTPEHFVILGERAHGYRIVTLEEQSPIGEDITLWNGVSTGHWDGNTLVIETTQQNGKSWLDQRARFYTEEATIVERLTLIGPNSLHYQATIDEPNVYTRPFTISVAYRRNMEGREVVEEPCYETNEALMEVYRFSGFSIFPGMTPEEARSASETTQ